MSVGKSEKAGFCVKKEKRADPAFDTCEGAATSGSGFLVPTNRASQPVTLWQFIFTVNVIFVPPGISDLLFFFRVTQQKMLIVIAGFVLLLIN